MTAVRWHKRFNAQEICSGSEGKVHKISSSGEITTRESQQQRRDLHLVWNLKRVVRSLVCRHPKEKEKHFYFLQCTCECMHKLNLCTLVIISFYFTCTCCLELKNNHPLFPLNRYNKNKI